MTIMTMKIAEVTKNNMYDDIYNAMNDAKDYNNDDSNTKEEEEARFPVELGICINSRRATRMMHRQDLSGSRSSTQNYSELPKRTDHDWNRRQLRRPFEATFLYASSPEYSIKGRLLQYAQAYCQNWRARNQ